MIALRAHSELTYKNPRQVVPFYMQPILHGSDDLRGFRPFRFYDDNSLLFQAEYRYEILPDWRRRFRRRRKGFQLWMKFNNVF